MAKEYKFSENEKSMMVKENMATYAQGITIPITLPTTGNYSVEYLKTALTDFAHKLLRRPMQEKAMNKKIQISERIQALSAVPASSSREDYKDEYVSMLAGKY